MTLIELLVSVVIIGAIVTVLAAAVTVTFRQQGDTQARLDVARWQQNLAAWMPSDLSSATEVFAEPHRTPCESESSCSFGSNALELRWDDGTGETVVSYRYGPSADGNSYELRRVECHVGSPCGSIVVLRDLSPPTDDLGNRIDWAPGDDVPDTVIQVTVPLDVLETDPDAPSNVPPEEANRAQRVIINVNGASTAGGKDRSSTVSFTAGGVSRWLLPPVVFEGPQFTQANSGCGGPVTLIVDESNSISASAAANIRDGVRSFIRTFEGTPTTLQVITFGTRSATLGATGGAWNRFFDLADTADVITLIGPSGTSGLVNTIQPQGGDDGGTNWEDAIRRAYYSQNGTPYSQLGNPTAPMPELVVFFTDGVPTFDRSSSTRRTGSAGPNPPSIPSRFDHDTAGNDTYGRDFTPRGWFRADYLIDQFRDSARLIGVGVGADFADTTRVQRSGWPSSVANRNIPNRVFLGDLVAGGDPSGHGTAASGNFVVREFSGGAWGDVSTADILITQDWNHFGSALTEIALSECGGTLTVQTRNSAGNPADANVTYRVGTEEVTTTRIQKAATFDIPLDGVASSVVELIPQPLDGTGLVPAGWGCKARGVDLPASEWHLLDPADVLAGIAVTVRANAAVSCTLRVSP